MNTITEVLKVAIESGDTVTIVYNGGSRPGEQRLVIPISLKNEKLVAREVGQGNGKQFILAKIASAILSTGELANNINVIPIEAKRSFPVYATLTEYSDNFRAGLAGAGWNVIEGNDFLGVSLFFKNGKPKNKAAVAILFVDRNSTAVFDLGLEDVSLIEHEPSGRERPWRVESARLPQAKAFQRLDCAMELFMKEVGLIDPKSAS